MRRIEMVFVLIALVCVRIGRTASVETQTERETSPDTTAHTLHPIISSTTSEFNPSPSPICINPKDYNISLLTNAPYWIFKLNKGCAQIKNLTDSCTIYMSFCKPIEDEAIIDCDGSSACIRYTDNQQTALIVGNFTENPFSIFERNSFELKYLPGVKILNQATKKECFVRLTSTFYCDLQAEWSEASPNEPGHGPEPTSFDFSALSDDVCEINMKMPYPGACSKQKPPKKGLSIGSILLIIFYASLSVYLSVGVAYNIFIEKKSGVHVFPHFKTWSLLYTYIVEGVVFAWRKVTCHEKNKLIYDTIGE